jgi:Transposase DDE domain group 1
VNRTYRKILRNRKARIQRRLAPKNFCAQAQPMLRGSNLHYEMARRSGAVGCGGIGAIHTLAQRLGLVKEIDEHLHLLKVHLPYHESDHVLNLAYNIMVGGVRLEDIELRRQDENFLNGLGAPRIPDPTTAGDFTRRFSAGDILSLQECINRTRQRVWEKQPEGFLAEAFIDVDGTIAGTQGECKEGIGLSYNGIWGYAPLLVSLANTQEALYLVNRPGNAASHQGSVEWIDRAIALVKPYAGKITLRGDTKFTHTAQLDRWDGQGIGFILGMEAHAKVLKLAEELPASAWSKLERLPAYEIGTEPREKRPRVKEGIVREKGFKNIVLVGEEVAQIEYQPLKCEQTYRLVILRKNLSVQRGEQVLFDEIRYLFYITNRRDLASEQVIGLAHGRCDQENVIEQLKNGVNALRMPVDNLESNWAYMVMAALAWNLKAWFALLMPARERGLELLRMEFRRFLQTIMLLPAQVVRTGRKLVYRILSYNGWLKYFFATIQRIGSLRWETASG